jgi:hypothetical protein
MADLKGFALAMQEYGTMLSGFVGEHYVEGRVHNISGDDEPESASRRLNSIVDQAEVDTQRTQLVFVRGRAGDGKSVLLTHLAVDQAKSYLTGAAAWLYFYVDAQGRALARIDEAIALILQDMGARFTYHCVSTLTRLGLVVPIIDGFDELLGDRGYRDAFASLSTMIGRLHGQGTIVASARSTFHHFSSFGAQAHRYASDTDSVAWRMHPLQLRPWAEQEVLSYLRNVGVPSSVFGDPTENARSALDRLHAHLGSSAREVLSSPFFYRRS